MSRFSPALRLALLVLVVVVLVVVLPRTEWGRRNIPKSFPEFKARVLEFSPYDRWAYVGLYIVGTMLLVPGTVLSFVGATLYGTLQGTLLTWIGAVIGSALTFGMVKVLGRDQFRSLVDRLFAGRFDAFDRWMDANGLSALIVVRLLPIFPFNGVNFGSALTNLRFGPYVLGTAIGILPGTFVYQYLFATIGERVLSDGVRWEDLADPHLWAPVVLFLLFIVGMARLARRIRRPAADAASEATGNRDNALE